MLALCMALALSAADKHVVVVIPFESPRSTDARELGDNAVEYFTVKLVESKKVKVVERNKLDKLFKEHELNLSGFVDVTKVRRALGKGTPADYAIMGRISTVGDAYSLSARLVNIETAEMEVAKEVSFRDLASLRVALNILVKNFLADMMGEKAPESRAEGMLNTDPKHFYQAAELLQKYLERLVPTVEGEINEIDAGSKVVNVGSKRAFGEVPLGTRLEVFRDEVSGNNKVGEIFVTKTVAGDKTLLAGYQKKSLGDTLQMGDLVSSRQYKARVGLGAIVDEAEDNEALVTRFRDTVAERLADAEHMGSVDYTKLGADLLAVGGGGRAEQMKDLFKKGVDFVVLGKFYGRPGDRRTDFKVYNAYTGKVVTEIKFDTNL